MIEYRVVIMGLANYIIEHIQDSLTILNYGTAPFIGGRFALEQEDLHEVEDIVNKATGKSIVLYIRDYSYYYEIML